MAKRTVFVDGGGFSGYVSIDVEPVEMSTIDCDIDDDTFLRVAKMAHERDITFNEMVTIILEEQLRNEKNGKTISGSRST